jgi:XTP/dITP diphosphohydrolase
LAGDDHPPGIILATRNRDKVEEIRAIFEGFPVPILSLDAFPSVPEVEEAGSSLRDNAILKAMAAHEATNRVAMADDSGLFVDALEGRPGVLSSRFAGEGATYADNNEKLLRMMEGIPWEERRARFICVVAVILAGGGSRTFRGEVEGVITERPREGRGFGYDPLFYHPPSGKTFAEMAKGEKNSLSHRSLAFRAAREFLRGAFAV